MSTRNCEQAGYVYIVANKFTTVMYVGVTSDLAKRISAHKSRYVEGIETNENTDDEEKTERLVYFEKHESIQKAILRRRELLDLQRIWIAFLIEKQNPDWEDRYQVVL
jgi:putative endonuclease